MRKFIAWFIGLFRKEVSVAPPEQVVDSAIVSSQLPELVQYQCGHEGPRRFRLEMLPGNFREVEGRRGCQACTQKFCEQHIVACGLCGGPIVPGDGVARYSGSPKVDGPRVAKVGGDFLGCLAWECCPSGGFFAGHWTEEGFKSAFAAGSAAGEALRTGKPVVGTTDGP